MKNYTVPSQRGATMDFDEIMRIQQLASKSLLNEQRMNNKIKAMGIINSLTGKKSKTIQVESFLIEARHEGMSESEANLILKDLEAGRIIKIKDGYIKKL